MTLSNQATYKRRYIGNYNNHKTILIFSIMSRARPSSNFVHSQLTPADRGESQQQLEPSHLVERNYKYTRLSLAIYNIGLFLSRALLAVCCPVLSQFQSMILEFSFVSCACAVYIGSYGAHSRGVSRKVVRGELKPR